MSVRVIYHPPVCPACESSDVVIADIETDPGITETAFNCLTCGEAWPLACVSDLEAQP